MFLDNFILERACKQGDPFYPYMYVFSADMLLMLIRNCEDVRGLSGGRVNISQSTG